MSCLLPLTVCVAIAAAPTEVRTKHYDLHMEVVDAEEMGRMLEQAYEQLERFFGAAPRERLRLELVARPEPLLDILKAEGVSPKGVGGYYSPARKKVIVSVQPSEYFTRQLILHEATHQFHYLAVTGNRSPRGFWYVEGVAEYFGMHNWDGKTLQVGVVPAITLEDYPAKALNRVTKHQADLQGLLHGKWGERPEAWGFIHYLVNNEPKRFRQLAQLLDRRVEPAVGWQRVFGAVTDRRATDWRRWIETHQQPWQIVWTSFQQRGDALEGNAKTNGLAVLKQTPDRLDVELEPVSGRLLAGLVFGYQSPEQFRLWQVQADKTVRLVERTNGKWAFGPTFPLPGGEERPRLAVVQSAKTATLYANDVRLTTVATSGRVGLNIDGCRVRFHVRTDAKSP